MASRGKTFSYRIGRRVGKQGLRAPVGNQVEVEKSTTGTNSSHHAPEDFHTEGTPQSGPHAAQSHNSSKLSRQKWSREEYKVVMEAFNKLLPAITQGTYLHVVCQ